MTLKGFRHCNKCNTKGVTKETFTCGFHPQGCYRNTIKGVTTLSGCDYNTSWCCNNTPRFLEKYRCCGFTPILTVCLAVKIIQLDSWQQIRLVRIRNHFAGIFGLEYTSTVKLLWRPNPNTNILCSSIIHRLIIHVHCNSCKIIFVQYKSYGDILH